MRFRDSNVYLGSKSSEKVVPYNFNDFCYQQLSHTPLKYSIYVKNSIYLQIKFCVIRNVSLLRKIYAFYAKLCKESIATRLSQGGGAAGQPHPQGSSAAAEDNTFVMEKLQFWQLLKDCRINEHEVTLVELDRLVGQFNFSTVSSNKIVKETF